ncbi:MAG TPA: biotin synthase BioB [Gammaproteobacteria bacterium]|nr:biotin synthase BioB [Gammaproteobacteria bacterium]
MHSVTVNTNSDIRHDWTLAEVQALLALPFNDLLYQAHCLHRRYFDPNAVQISTLLSIKTGACPEDCKYCPQSARYHTSLKSEKLMDVEDVVTQAKLARDNGATRFCMGAAYRSPKDKDLDKIIDMICAVRELGMETCATLGMLTAKQAQRLADAGLDYYNHNIDTSEDYYREIITTRCFQDRLDTLQHVRAAGMHVCCGGIIGMGESRSDHAAMLHTLATLPEHPESVPINQLVQVQGTPLHGREAVDPFDFIRVIAVARILMPKAHVRLSAGRVQMHDEMQALAFFAGANSIFCGEKLLTTENPEQDADRRLFERLGIHAEAYSDDTDHERGAAAVQQHEQRRATS